MRTRKDLSDVNVIDIMLILLVVVIMLIQLQKMGVLEYVKRSVYPIQSQTH